MSLLRHIGTYRACTHAYIHVSTMLHDDVMQLSNLLLAGYQFSSVRIPIRAVESEVLSSDSDSWQFRLSDSDLQLY